MALQPSATPSPNLPAGCHPSACHPAGWHSRDTVNGITFDPDDRVFFMFGSAGRDEAHFDTPDLFDLQRNTQPAISFGAGPHFCAGAAAARCLITDIALPLAFNKLKNIKITSEPTFTGWAFRGPLSVPVAWEP